MPNTPLKTELFNFKRHDIAQVVAIEQQLYNDLAYPELLFYQAVHQWPSSQFICRDADNILAYAMYAPAEKANTLWLMSAAVKPNCQGRGVGTKLLSDSLRSLDEQGTTSILLSVAPNNAAAVSVYEKLGFEVIETAEDYLGQGQHRLIMQRKITDKDSL
ncbi:ribosomal protein S18 acetylase RimI-like enzyme [Idiomarina fontislapidosi]|uniref:GNAT family N-acetyltransferase n=1 Tax=Idiomarina fontislapidosi TaxID=263723 RepID=UPI000D964C23|nr:N-acetyltransferase [Idiomarina fontislapidosi]PYE34307.1 ribosomal protein S18 acetylase RimI-like enzyme [Idiomarina fontislapidosi]